MKNNSHSQPFTQQLTAKYYAIKPSLHKTAVTALWLLLKTRYFTEMFYAKAFCDNHYHKTIYKLFTRLGYNNCISSPWTQHSLTQSFYLDTFLCNQPEMHRVLQLRNGVIMANTLDHDVKSHWWRVSWCVNASRCLTRAYLCTWWSVNPATSRRYMTYNETRSAELTEIITLSSRLHHCHQDIIRRMNDQHHGQW